VLRVDFMDYKIGSFLIGNNQPVNLPITFQDIKFIAKQAYLGGFVLATIASILLYFLLYRIVLSYRKMKT